MTSLPPTFGSTSLPSSSTTAASTPKNGSVAEPGLVGVAPGKGAIMWQPVSVCHHVSTIGHFLLPTFWWYHIHASGLIGPPPVRGSRREERSCGASQSLPHLMKERIAVGAV